MSHAQLLQLAKQGDTEAISTLLNQSLFVRRVTLVEANLNENCLELKLVSPKVPNQYKLIPFLRDEISSLGIDILKTVQVHALTDINSAPAWETSITLKEDWSTFSNLEDGVVKGKRAYVEESEDVENALTDENIENSVEESIATEENSPIIEIIEEVAETPIQSQQKSSRSLLPLALSFMIGLLTGLSIGYFLSPQKTSISEPTTYTIPQQ